jgi:hypothetical protein
MPTESAADAPRPPQLVCVDPARVQKIWPHVAARQRTRIVPAARRQMTLRSSFAPAP